MSLCRGHQIPMRIRHHEASFQTFLPIRRIDKLPSSCAKVCRFGLDAFPKPSTNLVRQITGGLRSVGSSRALPKYARIRNCPDPPKQ
jgi:hypothetical protein